MATIRELMTPDPITVRPDQPVKHALQLLIEHELSGLPVTDEKATILGVLSEKDVLKLFSEPEAPSVASIMTRDPITIDVGAELVEVFDCLMSHDFRRILISERGKLVGVISRADLMPAILAVLADREN